MNIPGKFPKRLLLDLAPNCNLKCKMCSRNNFEKSILNRRIKFNNFQKIIDEAVSFKPLIQPCLYGEPLLMTNFKEIVYYIKQRGLNIVINTNGTLINKAVSKFFIDVKVDGITVSLDAIKRDTYMSIRGVDRLPNIEKAIMLLLKMRGNNLYPRIGVSFVRQEANIDEQQKFIDFWLNFVDNIRVSSLICEAMSDKFIFRQIPKKRIACRTLYETMPIFYNGDAALCCRDAQCKIKMGNVFKESVGKIWNGPVFTKIRQIHEKGEWDKMPMCSKCDGWAQFDYKEEISGNFLIRSSPLSKYYNRIDRLKNWEGILLGGHKKPSL